MSNKVQLTPAEKLAIATALMDTGWDDIEDLPEYELLAIGTYRLNIDKCECIVTTEEGKQGLRVTWTFSVIDCIELANEADTKPEPGTMFTQSYFGEFGIKFMKRIFGNVCKAMEWPNPTVMVDNAANTKIMAVVGQRPDRNDKTKIYNDLLEAAIEGYVPETPQV